MIANAWVVWLILLLPLGAFLVVGLIGRRFREGGGYLVVGAMAGSLVLSLYVFVQVLLQGALGGSFTETVTGYVWLPSIGGAEIRISILIDNLSSLMLFLVAVLIIWIEFGELRFDVIAKGVGLLSPHLLTLIPLLLFGGAVGKSAQFPLHAWLPDAMEGPTTVSALIHAATMVKAGVYLTARSFIFLVPLAPGVQPPFTAILVIAGIGGFTAIFAATMAVVNNDIKRVLAFSTISQLAYMFLGLGAGAYLMATEAVNGEPVNSAGYSAALYHLFNHAFFKALLFLSAGSVIHAVHTNDMREMGGLSKSMPITSRVMLFGSLALAGIIPFSGFFSKGEILSVTFDAGADHPGFYLLYLLGLLTAFLTAFYAFRLWFMTFHGEYRGHDHPHESPRVMTTPLLILAGFTLISGLLAYPMQGFGNLVFFGRPEAGFPLVGIPPVHYLLEALSLGVAGLGIWLAWSIYETKRIPAERFTRAPGGAFIHRMLTKRYWIDDAYDAFGRTVVYGLAHGLDWFDRTVIDGIVNAVARGGMRVAVESDVFDRRVIDGAVNALSLETVRTSWRLRQRQTGQVQNYAWVVVVGIVAVVVLLFGFSFLQRFLGGR